MKHILTSSFPAGRTRVLLAVAAAALAPLASTGFASALTYDDSFVNLVDSTGSYNNVFEGALSNGTGAAQPTMPAGWVGFVGSTKTNTGASLSAFTETGSAPGGGAGLYYVSGLNNFGGSPGTRGLGSLSTNSVKNAFILELKNTSSYSFKDIGVTYTEQQFSSGSVAEQFVLEYLITTTELTNSQLLGATGWSLMDVDKGNFGSISAPITTAKLNQTARTTSTTYTDPDTFDTSVAVPLADNWDYNEYLYLRWFDPATSGSSQKGMVLNSVGFTATFLNPVPEPSSWVAAGLLLGCVGFSSLRRKTVVTAELAA